MARFGMRRPQMPRNLRVNIMGTAPRGSMPPLGKSLMSEAMINKSPIGGSVNVTGKQTTKKDGAAWGPMEKAVDNDD